MKYIIYALFFTVIVGCTTVSFNGESSTSKTEIVKFSKHVQKVIILNQVDHFLRHVESEYKQNQLEKALRGNTTQFLNEFFCGQSDSIYMCMDFDEISSIKLLEITSQKNDTYTLKYKLKSQYKETLTSEVFVIEKDSSFFFFSAVG